MQIDYDKDFKKVLAELEANFRWIHSDPFPPTFADLINDTIKATKNIITPQQ